MNAPLPSALFTPSWHAELELAYGRFGDSTRPTQRRHLGPLRVQKHLYAEGPQVCQHIIVHPPGGIAGGDRLNISADVGENAWAQLTSPGAAKWYRANGPAYQQIELQIAAGATLEWLPQETIVYAGAQAQLDTRIELQGDARLCYWDMVALGRPASGERFASSAPRGCASLLSFLPFLLFFSLVLLVALRDQCWVLPLPLLSLSCPPRALLVALHEHAGFSFLSFFSPPCPGVAHGQQMPLEKVHGCGT